MTAAEIVAAHKNTMKAIVYEQYGSPDACTTTPGGQGLWVSAREWGRVG